MSRYIALTEFAASRMVMAGFPKEKIVIKPNFLPTPPEFSQNKEDYIVFVGRLSEEKGVRTMLRAWKKLRDINLQILGDGPLLAELQNYAEQHGLPVTFHGSVTRDEVQSIVSKSRAMLIPSEWYEGFPMVILEAFANGTPVIASRIGSLDELITDGETGYKFEPGNIVQLQACVTKMFASDKSHFHLCRNARKIFDDNYTEHKNLRYIIDIYKNVLSE